MNDQVSQEAPAVEVTPEDFKRLLEAKKQEATEDQDDDSED